MQITLKNVKHYESMSEETNCFEATVYIDGKKAGSVSNRGCGGPNEMDHDLYLRLTEYAKTLPAETTIINGQSYTFPHSADSLIDKALIAILYEKEAKRFRKIFEKDIDTKVLYVKDGAVYGSKYGPSKALTPEMLAHRTAKISKLLGEGYAVLNALPFDEGFALWKQYVVKEA